MHMVKILMDIELVIRYTHSLFGLVARSVSLMSLFSSSSRAFCSPGINALHAHFSQQSQYAVGEVRFSLKLDKNVGKPLQVDVGGT